LRWTQLQQQRERENTRDFWNVAKAWRRAPTAVAYPCEESALKGAVEAAQMGLIKTILVGPIKKIEATARAAGLDLNNLEIVDAENSVDAAKRAVALVREGRAEVLMKGSLHSDELLGAVRFP
jgi:phosphate acetyltransferase